MSCSAVHAALNGTTMDKDPQAADSQQETEKPKKPSKPWPMWWVIAFLVVYLAIYTYWRLK